MKIILLSLMCFAVLAATAQSVAADSGTIARLNQRIDEEVVQQRLTSLDSMYATDFVFSHGTGKVEGKAGWLNTVAVTKYLSRRHDSVTVEMHPGLAIVQGNLYVQRVDKDQTARYSLRYIRVYAWREKSWQMISHITTREIHQP